MATPERTGEACEGNANAAMPPLLFLSHAGIDTEAARALKRRIEESPEAKKCGLRVWFDKDDLHPGEQWQPQLEEVIQRKSTAFIVYLGTRGVVNWVDAEVRLGLSRAVGDPKYRFIPIVAAGSAGPEALPGFAAQYQGVFDVEHRVGEFEKLMRAVLGKGDSGSLRLEEEPFFGLQAIDEKRSHLFFGREEETEDLVRLLRRQSLVMVTGDSGSGKSSLVRAGLVPAWRGGRLALLKGERPDDAVWHVVQMQPRSRPFSSLGEAVGEAARLLGASLQDRGTLADWVTSRGPEKVRRALRCDLPADATHVLLVVDQFEELVTIADPADRTPFVDLLLALADAADARVRVVLTMRRDYYNLCSQFEGFFRRLEADGRQARYLVGRIHDEGLRCVVTEPLRLAGLGDGDREALAASVLRDVGERPGDLALVQMALTETWRFRQGHHGDLLQAYAAVGGLEGAIAQAAEDVYAQVLDENERRLSESVFLRLVRLGDTAGASRRVARRAEFDDPRWALVQKLASRDGKRLLLVGDSEGAETAEIAHEALVTQWPRYQTWLQDAATDKRVLDQLIERATRFPLVAKTGAERAARHKSLATGAELDTFVVLASQRAEWLSSTELEFVKGSNAAAVRQRRRERWLFWGVVVAAALAIISGGIGWVQRGRALEQRAIAEQRAHDLSLAVADAHARLIWNNLEFTTTDLQPSEVDALWELATSEPSDRAAFLKALAGTNSLVSTFAKCPGPVLRALGLKLTDMQTQAALGPVLDAIKTTTDPDLLPDLAHAVQALPGKLTDEQARAALGPVLDAIKTITDPDVLAARAQAVKALPGRFTAAPPQTRLGPVLTISTPTSQGQLMKAVLAEQAVQALAGKLTDAQAQAAQGPILDAIKTTTDPDLLTHLALAVQFLPGKLTDEQARAALGPILGAIKTTTDPDLLTHLALAVQALHGKLTDAQAEAALGPVLDVITNTNAPYRLAALAQAVQALPGKLSDAQAQAALGRVLDAAHTDRGGEVAALAQAMQALAGKLTDTQAQAAFGPILDAMKSPTDPHLLPHLAQAMQALAGNLTDAQAQAAQGPILDAIKTTTDLYLLAALGQAMHTLPGKLTDAQAQAAFGPILDAMKAPTDPYLLPRLAQAVQALAGKLTDAQARAALGPILDAIMNTNDPYRIAALAQAMQALAGKLTDTQAQAALGPILDAITNTNDPYLLPALAQAVQAVAGKLTDAQAQAALGRVLDAIKTTTDLYLLAVLADAVQALGSKFTDAQAQAALGLVLDAIKITTDPGQLTDLAQAVHVLSHKFSTEAKVIALPVARSGLASARNGEEALAWVAAMEELLPSQPSKDYVAALLEAIRYPTAALYMRRSGQAGPTDYLLRKLRERFPEVKQLESGDLPAAVEWVAGPPLAIDLSVPLKRPPALSEAAASSSLTPHQPKL